MVGIKKKDGIVSMNDCWNGSSKYRLRNAVSRDANQWEKYELGPCSQTTTAPYRHPKYVEYM